MSLIIEISSWFGAAAVLASYARSFKPMSPNERWMWCWVNLLGAGAMLAESLTKEAWAPAALNAAWGFIAAMSLIRGPVPVQPPVSLKEH